MNNLSDVRTYVNGIHHMTRVEDSFGHSSIMEIRNMDYSLASCFNVLIDEIRELKARVKQLTKEQEERKRRQEEFERELKEKQDEERWLAELVKEDEKLRREMEGF